MYKITLDEYEFTNNNAVITVKRHGEEWKDYIGDNAVLALLHKIEDLEKAIIEAGCSLEYGESGDAMKYLNNGLGVSYDYFEKNQ